jgi:two-component system NtrC family response regulator
VVYHWPGNVRELANVIERAQILAEGDLLTLDDLPDTLLATPHSEGGASADPRRLQEVERRHVEEVLREAKGNKVQAARMLGISRRALYRLISKHHLESP